MAFLAMVYGLVGSVFGRNKDSSPSTAEAPAAKKTIDDVIEASTEETTFNAQTRAATATGRTYKPDERAQYATFTVPAGIDHREERVKHEKFKRIAQYFTQEQYVNDLMKADDEYKQATLSRMETKFRQILAEQGVKTISRKKYEQLLQNYQRSTAQNHYQRARAHYDLYGRLSNQEYAAKMHKKPIVDMSMSIAAN